MSFTQKPSVAKIAHSINLSNRMMSRLISVGRKTQAHFWEDVFSAMAKQANVPLSIPPPPSSILALPNPYKRYLWFTSREFRYAWLSKSRNRYSKKNKRDQGSTRSRHVKPKPSHVRKSGNKRTLIEYENKPMQKKH